MLWLKFAVFNIRIPFSDLAILFEKVKLDSDTRHLC